MSSAVQGQQRIAETKPQSMVLQKTSKPEHFYIIPSNAHVVEHHGDKGTCVSMTHSRLTHYQKNPSAFYQQSMGKIHQVWIYLKRDSPSYIWTLQQGRKCHLFAIHHKKFWSSNHSCLCIGKKSFLGCLLATSKQSESKNGNLTGNFLSMTGSREKKVSKLVPFPQEGQCRINKFM